MKVFLAAAKVMFFAVNGLLVGGFVGFVIDALLFMDTGATDGIGVITGMVIFGGFFGGIPGATLGGVIGLVIGVQKVESKVVNSIRFGVVGSLWGGFAGIAIYSLVFMSEGGMYGAVLGGVIGLVIGALKVKSGVSR